MAARGRLAFSFCAILLLFGVNFVVYLLSASQRTVTVANLDRSLNRVAVAAAVHQDLDNVSKEVALLSQLKFEGEAQPPDPTEQQVFFQRVDGIKSKIAQLQQLCDPGQRQEVDELASSYDKLAQSWKNFYQYVGAQQAKAIAELAVRGDPLTELVVTQLVPSVQRRANEQATAAKNAFHDTSQRTDQFAFVVFIISLVAASLFGVLGLQSTG